MWLRDCCYRWGESCYNHGHAWSVKSIMKHHTHTYIYSDYMHTPAACSVFCADTNYKLIGRPVEGCRGWWINVIILIPHGINIPWTNGTIFLQINQVNFWVEFYSWWVLNIIFKNAQVHAMFFILFNFCVNFYRET